MHLSNGYCAFVSDLKLSEFRRRLLLIVNAVFAGSESATAKAAGLRASTVHRMVTGAVSDPHSSTIDTMAEAFGVAGGWLRGELSTGELQGYDNRRSEPQWLLRCHADARQREGRAILSQISEGDDRRAMIRSISALRLMPGDPEFPLPEVAELLSRWPEDAPERLEVERKFADLETALIQLAASCPEDTPQTSETATTSEED